MFNFAIVFNNNENIMKKSKIAMLIVAVSAIFAGYNMYQAEKYDGMSDIMLANIEALADGESSSGCYPTICNKSCQRGNVTYIYEYSSKCYCSLCTGN